MEDTTGSGGLAAESRSARTAAGRRLQDEYRALFPGVPPGAPTSTEVWQSAAGHGATLQWALQADERLIGGPRVLAGAFRVGWALRLASAVPVSVIDELLGAGWTLNELLRLMCKTGIERPSESFPETEGFPETARRLGALHQVAPELGGPDGSLLWHALAAVLSADPVGLTDLQALRWLQVLMPETPFRASGYFAWLDRARYDPQLQGWVLAAGPDGWAWLMAGYTPDQARVLRGLPETHPDRPGPDQLTVMAALQQA